MEDFLDIVLPPLLLFLAVAGFIAGLVWVGIWWIRLLSAKGDLLTAKRKQITNAGTLLDSAADVLAAVISDEDTSDSIRKEALTVYSEINEAKGSK